MKKNLSNFNILPIEMFVCTLYSVLMEIFCQ